METILCAVDFSPFALQVVRTGDRLARLFGARLIVFHAVNFPIDAIFGSDRLERGVKTKRLMSEARDHMAALEAGLTSAGETVLVGGDPVEALEALIRNRRVDLVVTASRGIGGVERLFVGTVVERMVLKIARPILILRPSHGPPRPHEAPRFARIMVGCDLRLPRDPALNLARRLARSLAAELHLLHVIEAPLEENLDDPYNESQQALQEGMTRRLMQLCPDPGPDEHIFAAVYPGVPAEALQYGALECGCDLVVTGVHRVGALKGALIGTTARQLLRKAPCSLLTVPEFTSDTGCEQ